MNTRPAAAVADLRGLWTRSLLAWPDGRRDVSTAVHWLQGPSLYVDLRQPAGRPDFGGVRGLEDVDDARLAWLVTQEGFAGRLGLRDGCFEWARAIDFQPPSPAADAGHLRFEADRLVEEGRDLPYVEHWHRVASGDAARCVALRLAGVDDARRATLVRVGEVFMLAVDRAQPLARLADLAACVWAAPDRAARLACVDCELSFGRVTPAGWRLERSSLPWREGTRLAPALRGARLELGGSAGPFEVQALEGEAAALA